MAYLLVGCQALLLAIFALSVLGKIRSRAAWSAFVRSVRELRLVPVTRVRAVAVGTVAGEGAVLLLLAVPFTAPAGLILAAMLLGVFTLTIMITIRRGVRAVCRCFGGSSTLPLGTRHVVRNAVLITAVVLATVGIAADTAAPHPGGVAVAAAAGLIAAVILIFFDEIVELFASPPVAGTEQQQQGRI